MTYILLYIALGIGAVIALGHMILRIGKLMDTCPQNGPAIRVATVTVATGFAAIGTGGVVLIGALPLVLRTAPVTGLVLALGLATLSLGLGFTQAVATLQAVVKTAAPPIPEGEPQAA